MLDFFKSGQLLQQVNVTNITMVPKVDCPKRVGEFRPITCCNVIYKIITKLMTKRKNEVLPFLISESQTTFVQGRSIMTNILVCQDLVHNYNKNGEVARCLMKIDLQKAYDTVSWDFFLSVLRAIQFPAQFISWIEVCLKTSRFSVLLNGLPCGYFQGKRGLRYGDPISTYLFVLAMEYLTRKLLELDGEEEFRYHSRCKQLKLTHLTFAYDIMLVCKADRRSPLIIMQKFEEFSATSGLRVNSLKSQMFLGGTDDHTKQFLLEKLGFF